MGFDIADKGATKEEAVHKVAEGMATYLISYFEDGAPFSDALRPIPRSLRLRISAETARARLFRLDLRESHSACHCESSLVPAAVPRLSGSEKAAGAVFVVAAFVPRFCSPFCRFGFLFFLCGRC